tara:strand:+ start:828 stop:1154 length:327 start_codon:yes stop_codon:yes gene_type:complete
MATSEQIKERGGKWTHRVANGVRIDLTDKEIEAKVDQELEDEANPVGHWRALREQRNSRLAESDWMAGSDAPTMSDAWKAYRQELRDLPSKYDNSTVVGTITYPTKPE